LIRNRNLPSSVWILASSAASWAPSAIVWPTYGVRENGALTAISSVSSDPFESSPPHAGTTAQRRTRRARRFKGRMLERLASEVRGSHGVVRGDFGKRARSDPPAGLEDGHDIRDEPDEAEVVLNHEQAEALLLE
jgi:hypothetical protein